MPQYNFLCRACKKEFSKILTLSEHEKGKIVCPHCKQGRRAAVGSLLCSDLEEELIRLSLWDHISARETPGKEKSKPGGVFCQGVSPWDEPCMIVATKYCERCNRWFCQTHFGDPDWHSCTEEEQ
jgi:putative FmdB family regulatory protein